MSRRVLLVFAAVIGLSVVLVGSAAMAVGTTYFVNNGVTCDDLTVDSTVTPFCSIQGAVDEASSGDEIVVAAGTYTATGSRMVVVFQKDLTITGAGEGLTILDGENARGGIGIDDATVTLSGMTLQNMNSGFFGTGISVYEDTTTGHLDAYDLTIKDSTSANSATGLMIFTDASAHLERVTFSGNHTDTSGGAIWTSLDTTLDIVDSVFTDNDADVQAGAILASTGADVTVTGSTFSLNTAGVDGGAIWTGGSDVVLTIENSTFEDNTATTGAGGAVLMTASSAGAVLDVAGSTFTGNTAATDGGAIEDQNGASTTASIENSTFSDNTATAGNGGAIRTSGQLYNVTISGNTAGGDGGGLAIGTGASPGIRNSIVALNTATGTGNECDSIVSHGYNLVFDDGGCTIAGDLTGNILGEDPKLSPPADNGGPTATMLLDPSSLAIGGGSPAVPGSGSAACLGTDQRGNSRVPDADCDMGAYEYYECEGLPATIVGTNGADTMTGTDGDDVITGLGGNDLIDGREGDDLICGGNGADEIYGNIGNDRVFGDAGDDIVDAGDGIDYVRGGNGEDHLIGGPGRDRLFGDAQNDTLEGGPADDRLFGGAGDDILEGDGGDDKLRGGGGVDDKLDGGPGDADDCIGETEINCDED